jgi:mono/diheme cytochrome c family protein
MANNLQLGEGRSVRPGGQQMKPAAATVLILLAGSLATAQAVEQAGLVEDGLRIARETCAECHVVEGDRKPSLESPSFAAVAAMPSTTSVSIKVFLKTPHANMPDIILSEAEIDALAAYILSLRKR